MWFHTSRKLPENWQHRASIFVFSVVEFLGDNLAFDLKVSYINGHYYAGKDSTCFLGDEGKSLILVKQPLHDLHILSKCIPRSYFCGHGLNSKINLPIHKLSVFNSIS